MPALNQLLLPFLSLVSVAELQRNPTVKDEAASAGITSISGLMLTYPVHQAADILFCKANVVPVGKDQLPHIEQTRVVARRFNERYAPIFPEPGALLSEATPAARHRRHQDEQVARQRDRAADDAPTRPPSGSRAPRPTATGRSATTPRTGPRWPTCSLIAAMCEGGDPATIAEELGDGGGGGLKKRVTEAVNEFFAPLRKRREELAGTRRTSTAVLHRGNERANEIADATLARCATPWACPTGEPAAVPTLTDGVVTLRAPRRATTWTAWSSSAATPTWRVDHRAGAVRARRREAVRAEVMPGGWESDLEWGFAVEHEGRFAGTVMPAQPRGAAAPRSPSAPTPTHAGRA